MKPQNLLFIFFSIIFIAFNSGCSKNSITSTNSALNNWVEDIDGNKYDTIVIDNLIWFKSNLRVSRFNNGDTIPEVKSDLAWINRQSSACCSYNNDKSNDLNLGKLYNGYVLTESRNACPIGWRIPGPDDWRNLFFHFGVSINGFIGRIDSTIGGALKAKSSLWNSPNYGATDIIGFSALPAGYRGIDSTTSNNFHSKGMGTYFWSTDFSSNLINYGLYYLNANIIGDGAAPPQTGGSIRCVKNN